MIALGTRLGPYEIQSFIGSGGMGEVYKARDTRLDRVVALKVLSPQLAADPHFRERFEREARATSQLNHPHICALYDVGHIDARHATADGSDSYLVMEFVEGENLAERLTRGPLPLDHAIAYSTQLAEALVVAHRKGFVHRDLKPGNIMVTKGGVKVLDFGLAEQRAAPLAPGWADTATRTMPIVSSGTVLGTLQYLAPEQLEGRPVDHRTDIFACGAVIYEMLTGRKAFAGDSRASVIAAIMGPDRPTLTAVLPSAPPALEHVVSTCLALDPEQRWQDAGDLARELKWIATPGPHRSILPVESVRARSAFIWPTVAALLLLTTAALAGYLFFQPPSPVPAIMRTVILLPSGLRFPVAGPIGGVGRFALSPDGRRLAFVASDPNGSQMLWLRPLDSLTAVSLPGTEGASSPFWSRDSRLIAFVAQGQLKTIDPAGGSPVVVTTALNATGAWTGDNEIVYTPSAASALHRVPPSGGTPRPVTTLDKTAGDVLHRNPSFLPDGRHFLYVAVGSRNGGSTGARAVHIGSIDPTEPSRRLIDNATAAKYAAGHVVFLRETMLMAQPFDTGRLALTGESRPVAEQVELNGPASAAFTMSDAGVLAYQPAVGQGSQLLWFDQEGRQIGSLGDAAQYGDVELSPDGRLAVVSVLDPATNTRDLWLIDVGRGVRTRFTFDREDDVAPVWSPDGSHVFFTSNRKGHFDLYRKAASGVGVEDLVLADGADKYPTSLTPDGRSILYWTFDADGANLSMLRLSGEPKPERFLGLPVGPGRLSPNGRFVAYSSGESGRSEIYVVPFPVASRKWQLSSAGGTLPRWRGDGKELFYAARDNRIMAVPLDSDRQALDVGLAHPLFDARPVGPRNYFDVSADGRRFLVNSVLSESLSSSIAIVQHWNTAAAP